MSLRNQLVPYRIRWTFPLPKVLHTGLAGFTPPLKAARLPLLVSHICKTDHGRMRPGSKEKFV